VAVADVARFETELLAHIHGKHADLLEEIRTQKTLTDEREAKLKAVLDGFVATFA
jgi:F-type H+-transporting ATPase subunit alpha